MAGLSDEAIKALKMLAGNMLDIECTVVSVDKDSLTCTVQPSDDSEAEFEGVRINSDREANTYYLPAVGSSVIVRELDKKGEAYVVFFSVIDDIALAGTNNGGLVIFSELSSVLLDIVEAFKNVPTALNDGGATGFSAIGLRLAGITKNSISAMENKTVQHGSN